MKLQETYPEKPKTELRKLAPDIYAFLYRNDREWLDNYSPVKKRIQPPNQRINWENRDKDLLKRVKEVIRYWDIGEVKTTKITITNIGKQLNELSLLLKKADKLP